jgi:dihydroflavonol-4-reductase
MKLITGGTGHIGNVLARALVARGERVRVLLYPGESTLALDDLDVERVEGDILDPEALERALAGVDMVYHLAGMISISTGADPLVALVNVQGTRNVVSACLRAGVRRLVYTSSIHAIRHAAKGVVMDECLPFDPNHTLGEYDRSKARASLAVLEALDRGLDAVIVCPTGVIGPHDYRLSEMGRLMLSSIRNPVQLITSGAYDFVDVRDVAQGIILAGDRGRAGEVYILSGEAITLQQLVRLTRRETGKRGAVVHIPYPVVRLAARVTPLLGRITQTRPLVTRYSLETVMGNCAISHAKASRELGYCPRPLQQTVRDTVRWFLENRHLWKSKHSL